MLAFALGFIRYSSSVSLGTAQGAYSYVLRLLRWLKNNQDHYLSLTAALQSDHTKALAKDWEDTLQLWQDYVIAQPRPGPSTKYNIIKHTSTVLRRMTTFGVIPHITYARVPRNLNQITRPIRTLAEWQQNIKKGSEKILEKVLSGMKGTNTAIQIKKDFLTTLLNETGEIAGSANAHAKILMKINADRIEMIRDCACKDFKKWRDVWIEGQRLLQAYDISFNEIAAIVDRQHTSMKVRMRELSTLFPDSDPELSLACLLRYLSDHPEYRGQIMRFAKGTLRSWEWRQAGRFGGLETLQAYLFPHQDLTAAAIIIVLCDTGANISVARTLSYECLEDSKEIGYQTLKGIKMRAGGKLIVNELPVKDPTHDVSCIEIIQTYQSISSPLRRLATEKAAESLFLYIGWSGSIKCVDNGQWGKMFRAFRKRHAEFRNVNVHSKMIRPSVLMQAAYDKETGIIAAAAIGDHNSFATTDGYIARYPNQLIWGRMIREFQSLFQVISIQNIKGAASKLGLAPKQVKNLLSEAHRTGLGVMCLDPCAGLQPGSEKGKLCTQPQNCPGCANRFVIATVENLKDLVLWNCHLEQQRPEWERTRPERWERVWLPWLIFTTVAIEQASRGRTVREFKKAKELADEQIASNRVNFGPLW